MRLFKRTSNKSWTTIPQLNNYIAVRDDVQCSIADIYAWSGRLKKPIGKLKYGIVIAGTEKSMEAEIKRIGLIKKPTKKGKL